MIPLALSLPIIILLPDSGKTSFIFTNIYISLKAQLTSPSLHLRRYSVIRLIPSRGDMSVQEKCNS